MSKRIKIIELLNKIANGEEFPKKVKFEDRIYTYYNEMTDYKNENYFLFDMISDGCVKDFLNDTVEIIEEQEEIDIKKIDEIHSIFIENSTCGEDVKFLARKYNELVQAVKQLDKNIKEMK